ncbi:MAG: flagellar motor protein MotA, partial [Paracraurococcus sp.]
MTPPLRFLWRMLGFLAVVALLAALLAPQLATAFATNLVLNSLILGVLFIGILWNLRQVLSLRPEVDWLEHFRSPKLGAPAMPVPRLLGPMASMFQARRSERLSLSAPAMRSVLDGIASRLDESRELSRYMTGLLIFLGLLGTFWGLIETVGSVGTMINTLKPGGDAGAIFDALKEGLATPLSGMG